MESKLLGLILIVGGIAVAAFVWLITQQKAPVAEPGKVRRYKLRHEYSKKGLTEKNQSEGVMDVPENYTEGKDVSTEDVIFGDNLQDNINIHPGDHF